MPQARKSEAGISIIPFREKGSNYENNQFKEVRGSREAETQVWDFCCSVAKSCLILCNPWTAGTLGFPVLHYFPEFSQTYLHWGDITLLTKVCTVKAMVFPVVIYGCESRTIKKAEHPRIDAFELWCWRRLLRVPWTTRRSNQKEINPEYSLEGLILNWSSNTLATWCEEPTHWKRPWCWERLRAGEEGGNSGWDGLMPPLTQWTWVLANSRR